MSTHIGDAWLIPTNRLPALVAIAQKATEIHRATIAVLALMSWTFKRREYRR